MEELIAFMAGALWSPDTTQERRDELMAQQGEPQQVLTAEERSAIDRSLAGFDLRPGLGSITARTLVISGRSDGLNPPESGEEVASLIPGARFEVYEHSGHMLAYEEMDSLVDEVTRFTLG
jgi:3-oxoadipate enol-lactonase